MNKQVPALIILLLTACCGQLWATGIDNNVAARQLTLTDHQHKLSLTVDYAHGVFIRQLLVAGKNVLAASGACTGFSQRAGQFVGSKDSKTGVVKVMGNEAIVTGITYGNDSLQVQETWTFALSAKGLSWRIRRQYNHSARLEDNAFPQWNFQSLDTWKGGILDNGGVVWCKYLRDENDTYGVHTGGVTFWSPRSGAGLKIAPTTAAHLAAVYRHGPGNTFQVQQTASDTPLQQRYHQSRFVQGRGDVFAPAAVAAGACSVQYELEYVDYPQTYSRGHLPGIDSIAVRELLNTTARYGVVDDSIVGGNGWVSNWKCLHEPFFAQIALAVNDSAYTHNLAASLDREQKFAITPAGRVLSRWHDVPGDEIAGTYNAATGYYEAMWGYTIDSQTGYVINTSELFDLLGDVAWLQAHRVSCEQALDWLLARDSDHNGIYEMMNNGIADARASDWLDIVWASYENAFVNAQLYRALTLWAHCEGVMGRMERQQHYDSLAVALKKAFNRPVAAGGFWSESAGQYVYWRDKDGSIHGDNLVTPVNFAVIAFGLCGEAQRKKIILEKIEQRMQAEHLFHWPLCFDSFRQDEVQGGNWPFPRYENGDIFPTWGYLGIGAYTGYDKHIALKYIQLLLQQYQRDGLSSQRYSRVDQKGQGDDILSGICTAITALYKDIYGICPKWNRMGLEPHLDAALNNTTFYYTLRDTVYHVVLNEGNYQLTTRTFSVGSNSAFGISRNNTLLQYYHLNSDHTTLSLLLPASRHLRLEVQQWTDDHITFRMNKQGNVQVKLEGLPVHAYRLLNGTTATRINATADGRIAVTVNSAWPVTITATK